MKQYYSTAKVYSESMRICVVGGLISAPTFLSFVYLDSLFLLLIRTVTFCFRRNSSAFMRSWSCSRRRICVWGTDTSPLESPPCRRRLAFPRIARFQRRTRDWRRSRHRRHRSTAFWLLWPRAWQAPRCRPRVHPSRTRPPRPHPRPCQRNPWRRTRTARRRLTLRCPPLPPCTSAALGGTGIITTTITAFTTPPPFPATRRRRWQRTPRPRRRRRKWQQRAPQTAGGTGTSSRDTRGRTLLSSTSTTRTALRRKLPCKAAPPPPPRPRPKCPSRLVPGPRGGERQMSPCSTPVGSPSQERRKHRLVITKRNEDLLHVYFWPSRPPLRILLVPRTINNRTKIYLLYLRMEL